MASSSPLNPLHQQAEASFLTYGIIDRSPGPGPGPSRAFTHAPGTPEESPAPTPAPMVVETFGELEGEYAALRKGCVVLDLPQRGTLRVTGKDRIDFLNRMVTQELKGMSAFRARSGFWLSRKGRIDADLRMIELEGEMLIDLDILAAARTVQSLAGFIFSEEVELTDLTERRHRLALHGPTALRLLHSVSEPAPGGGGGGGGGGGPTLGDLAPGMASIVSVAGHRVIVDRLDATGETGLELLMEVEHVGDVYEQLLERGLDDSAASAPEGPIRLRPAGWHAYNIARIEAGTPLFNVDFGTGSLPHETGILGLRVSFTKGCYVGQEVVARMQSLGHPKQQLVGLRLHAPPESEGGAPKAEIQPVTGAAIFRTDDPQRTPVGAVTSSTRSPMLGDACIGFAQVKWELVKPGTRLLVDTASGPVESVVQPGLAFWSPKRA